MNDRRPRRFVEVHDAEMQACNTRTQQKDDTNTNHQFERLHSSLRCTHHCFGCLHFHTMKRTYELCMNYDLGDSDDEESAYISHKMHVNMQQKKKERKKTPGRDWEQY